MFEVCTDPEHKILTREALEIRFRDRGGLVCVFTNGCFDLIHRGHAEYLYRARQLGDRLVVGLNSDHRVGVLKGAGRPFVPESDRAYLLASLACVDYVTVFDEPTPEALLALLKPDIHVKGGDYSLEDLPEAAVVRSYGGQIVLLPYLPGRSSSGLAARIRSGS